MEGRRLWRCPVCGDTDDMADYATLAVCREGHWMEPDTTAGPVLVVVLWKPDTAGHP